MAEFASSLVIGYTLGWDDYGGLVLLRNNGREMLEVEALIAQLSEKPYVRDPS